MNPLATSYQEQATFQDAGHSQRRNNGRNATERDQATINQTDDAADQDCTSDDDRHRNLVNRQLPGDRCAKSEGCANRNIDVAAEDDDGWFVDYDQVKHELVQISLTCLGDRDSAPVAQLIERAHASIDDLVATIDTIRTLEVPGHDPTAVHAMAREMHQHAAERLCGA